MYEVGLKRYNQRSNAIPCRKPWEAGMTNMLAMSKYGSTSENMHLFTAPNGLGEGNEVFNPPCLSTHC